MIELKLCCRNIIRGRTLLPKSSAIKTNVKQELFLFPRISSITKVVDTVALGGRQFNDDIKFLFANDASGNGGVEF